MTQRTGAMELTQPRVWSRPVTDADPLPCPSKGKRKFKTRREAEASLSTIWRHGSRNGPGPLPCRSYRCRCGHWHLTSKPRGYLSSERGEVESPITDGVPDQARNPELATDPVSPTR